jgi:hypothetical protein
MADLLIRDIDPELKRLVEERARDNARNLSDEAKSLIRRGLSIPDSAIKMGTWMFSLVPPEYRVDLDCDYPDVPAPPPDFD